MTRRWVLALAVVLSAGLVTAGAVAWAGRDQVSTAPIDRVDGERGSRELTVTFITGPSPECGEANGVTASETDTTVTLTATTVTRDVRRWRVWEVWRVRQETACPAMGVLARRTVTLAAPLANRRLVDAYRLENGRDGAIELGAP